METSAGWLTNPVALRRIYDQGVAALNALPADTPSLRLLADQTAEVLAGVSCALQRAGAPRWGLCSSPVPRRGGIRLHVPNWLPPLVDAARVAWLRLVPSRCSGIRTRMAEWCLRHNLRGDRDDSVPHLRGDQAYPATMSFMIGTFLVAALAAIIGFRGAADVDELPSVLASAIGLVLVPRCALQGWPSRGRRQCLPP